MSRSWCRKAAPEIPTNGIESQEVNLNNHPTGQTSSDSTEHLKPNHKSAQLLEGFTNASHKHEIETSQVGTSPGHLHNNACNTVHSDDGYDEDVSVKAPNLEGNLPECTEFYAKLFNVPFQLKKVPVSINLSVVCRRVIELFQRFDQHADYLGPSSAHETLQKLAVYRYEVFWLPLAAAHKLYAGAPIDIHWVWLAHMLDPLVYRQDCQR
ncbi:hypothetical protein P879_01719 [Paragonimus westermani]|uniref:Uncharacterized protein n=1 Tax=Paragonimus westermani TaxID=34504 RepID=A0A8T0DWZ3_9TREM|nr:hypothetical protein P879_01719 [Paragonimus westermani]